MRFDRVCHPALSICSAERRFHTYDYARHFLSSVTRILGLATMPNGIEFEGRYAQVGTYPIGIEPTQFVQGLQSEKVQTRLKELEKRFEGTKVMVGVDRLDYIKGIPQKLHALEVFLTQHPEWVGKVGQGLDSRPCLHLFYSFRLNDLNKTRADPHSHQVVLVQLAVPSRQDVEEYQNLRATVNELIGRINGRFGTVEFTPIHYMHKSVPFEELTAMYALSDACLITSTRDGMNLVSRDGGSLLPMPNVPSWPALHSIATACKLPHHPYMDTWLGHPMSPTLTLRSRTSTSRVSWNATDR